MRLELTLNKLQHLYKTHLGHLIFESCFIMSVLIAQLIKSALLRHCFELDHWEWILWTILSTLLTEFPLLSYHSMANPLFFVEDSFFKRNRLYSLSLLTIKRCLKISHTLLLAGLYQRTQMILLHFHLVQQQQKMERKFRFLFL